MIKTQLKIFVFLLLFNAFGSAAKGQDYTYSQFYANPLYLNPALAGAEYCPRIIVNYRNQWPSLPGAFVSYSASYDQYSEFLSGGLGVQVDYNSSGQGALYDFQLSGMYAYNFQISDRMEANLALQAGMGNRGLNASKLDFGNNNPSLPPPNLENYKNNLMYPDFATGFVVGYDEKYFLGAAVHHLASPDISLNTEDENLLKRKYTLHAGANFGSESSGGYRRSSGPSLIVSPNIMYQQQGQYRQLNLGTYFTLAPFVAGLWFRHAFVNPDAIIVSLGLVQKNLRLGYSFDYSISSLAIQSGGAHEISLSWTFACDQKRKRSRAIKCPSF